MAFKRGLSLSLLLLGAKRELICNHIALPTRLHSSRLAYSLPKLGFAEEVGIYSGAIEDWRTQIPLRMTSVVGIGPQMV